eukprot:gene5007-8605_t
MSEKSFQVSDYIIQFKSLFLVPEIENEFHSFLKKEYNSDHWDFIAAVVQLEKLAKKKSYTKVFKQIQFINSEFIEENSPKQVMIGKKHRQIILSHCGKLSPVRWNIDVSSVELYEPLKQLVLLEYKNDSFKRFTRTPECAKLIEKYQNNRQVLLPQLSVVYNYSGSKFQNKEFTAMDIEFLKAFEEEDPNWELSYTDKKSIMVFLSNWNYFPNVFYMTKHMFNFKVQLTFDYSFQQVALAVFNNYFESDPNMQKSNCLEYKHGQYVILEHLSGYSSLSFDNEPRVRRATYTMEYEPDKKRISLRSKPLQIPDILFLTPQQISLVGKKGENETTIKGVQSFMFYTTRITEIDENKTMFEQIAMIDIAKSLTKSHVQKRAQTMHANYLKKLKTLGNAQIKDYKLDLNTLWEGLPVKPIGKLLSDLQIDKADEVYQEKIEKRKKVFDISNYVVHFSSLKRKEIEKVYYEFLKLEHNTDSWDFISEVNVLQKLGEKKKFKDESKKIEQIISLYILPKSSRDLSISKEKRDELFSNLENRKENYPVFKYFEKIYNDIRLEHQMDSFKRFGKSKMAKDVLAKYQHDILVMSPILGLLSIYKDFNFSNKFFSIDEMDFVSSITTHSSTWDTCFTNPDVKISISKVNWFPEVSFIDSKNVVSYHYEYQLPFPLEQVANGYLSFSKMAKIDPNIQKSKVLDYFIQEDLNPAVLVENEIVWFWGKSEKQISLCSFFAQRNELIFLSKPYKPHNEQCNYFQYDIITLSEYDFRTTFQHVILIYSKEKLNIHQAAIERGQTFYLSMMDSISNSYKYFYDMETQYSEMDGNTPKDPFGNILLSLKFDQSSMEKVEFETESGESFSDNTLSNPSSSQTQSSRNSGTFSPVNRISGRKIGQEQEHDQEEELL